MFDYTFHLAFKVLHSDYNLVFQLCASSAVLKARSRKPTGLVEEESGAFKNITAIRKM